MIALAAQQQWHMTSVDVKTAFLYGELDEELFMEQPEGFAIKGQEHKVFHLKRALYGLNVKVQDLDGATCTSLYWASSAYTRRCPFERTWSEMGC